MSKVKSLGFAQSGWGTVFINGNEVGPGDDIKLSKGQPNEIRVEVTSDEIEKLRLGLGDSDSQSFTAVPPFDEPVDVVEGACVWQVTPRASGKASATLVVYSADAEGPLTIPCRISDFHVRFINLIDHYLPYPPTKVLAQINLVYASAVQIISNGSPVSDIPVTFDVPDHESQTVATGPGGKAAMLPVVYKTPGVRKIQAVAALPDGECVVEVVVDFGSYGGS
ncbi:hypothetical protein [Pseudomonas sp. MYb118]|uniref:hypothetical protein n=1 Tax=Pseudomonas sp. MYb118 TaxID=1848720 RepID=UPI0034CDF465